MTRVSAIIPTWNGRHLLPFCLHALAAQSEVGMEIIVVDNGSMDGTAQWLAKHHPGIRVLSLGANRGFASAVNAGAAAASGAYLLVLNNDAALEPDYVCLLADLLDARPQAAACQGRVLRHDDPSVVDSLGIRFDWLLRAYQEGHGQRDPGATGNPRAVPGVSACAALYRTAALRDVADPDSPPSIFDPVFFAYYEDVDLALRLTRRGWQSYLHPAAACFHVGSATGVDGSWGKTFLLGRNYLLYLARHSGSGGLAARLPGLFLRGLRRLLTLPLHPRRDVGLIAGELAALPRLPAALFKGRRDRRRLAAAAPTRPRP